MNNDQRYERIKGYGFHIDVRGPLPLLVRGTVATSYPTTEAAIAAAETTITDETKGRR